MPLACEVRRPQVLPPRKGIIDTSLVLYAPLWHPDLAISPFLSKNPGTQHSCTVTGALWTPQGRAFDANSSITIPNTGFASDQQGTILIWFKSYAYPGGGPIFTYSKIDDFPEDLIIVSVNDEGELVYMVVTAAGGIIEDLETPVGAAPSQKYNHLAVRSNGSTTSIFINTVPQSLTIVWGANLGSWFGDLTLPTHIVIGAEVWYGEVNTGFKGIEGSFTISHNFLSEADIQDDFLKSKWRYT